MGNVDVRLAGRVRSMTGSMGRKSQRFLEMDVKPIKTEDDYDAALAEVDRLMGSPIDSPEGDKLEVLVTLVEAYEAVHWPIEAPRSRGGDRACHGGERVAAEGSCGIDRLPTTSVGNPEPPPPADAANDPGVVGQVEAPDWCAGARVFACRLAIGWLLGGAGTPC